MGFWARSPCKMVFAPSFMHGTATQLSTCAGLGQGCVRPCVQGRYAEALQGRVLALLSTGSGYGPGIVLMDSATPHPGLIKLLTRLCTRGAGCIEVVDIDACAARLHVITAAIVTMTPAASRIFQELMPEDIQF